LVYLDVGLDTTDQEGTHMKSKDIESFDFIGDQRLGPTDPSKFTDEAMSSPEKGG
jgi:hypothetical protein